MKKLITLATTALFMSAGLAYAADAPKADSSKTPVTAQAATTTPSASTSVTKATGKDEKAETATPEATGKTKAKSHHRHHAAAPKTDDAKSGATAAPAGK